MSLHISVCVAVKDSKRNGIVQLLFVYCFSHMSFTTPKLNYYNRIQTQNYYNTTQNFNRLQLKSEVCDSRKLNESGFKLADSHVTNIYNLTSRSMSQPGVVSVT